MKSKKNDLKKDIRIVLYAIAMKMLCVDPILDSWNKEEQYDLDQLWDYLVEREVDE